MIEAATVVRPMPKVAYRELSPGSGAVLLHLESTAYHGLNEVGALAWTLLADGITFGALLAELRKRLEGAPSDLAADMAEFLEDLSARDLVILESAPPPDPR